MADSVSIDFSLGIGSRYSYLAATQLDRIENEHGCRFVWKPIASGLLMDRRGNNPFRMAQGSGQYDWGYRTYDAGCWAAYYGVPFQEPAAFRVDPVLLPLACPAADVQGALKPCCRLLQRMIFVEGTLIDESAITELPRLLGLDGSKFRSTLGEAETRAGHEALLDEAIARGAFGVPTFFLREHMFWGNDRLLLLEAALRGLALPATSRPGARAI